MSSKVQEISYQPGDYILREGAQCDALFIVKKGQIEIFRTDTKGSKIPVGIVKSGEYLGEMSLLSERPHTANAVALTDTVCAKITGEALEEQLKKAPSWLVALTRGLIYKLINTNNVLKRNGIVDASISDAVKAIENKSKAS